MTRPRIGCAILAAGASRRLGTPKQLVRFRGVPLVRIAASAARASSCDEIAVVVGARAPEVAFAVHGLGVATLVNEGWCEGMGSSLRVAAGWARARACDALVVAVCDQPLLDAAQIDALVAAYEDGASVVASTYAKTVGVPALFGSAWFDRLLSLAGDRGAGALLRGSSGVRTIAWPSGAIDVDTVDDVASLQGRA